MTRAADIAKNDQLWSEEKAEHRWSLPPAAPLILRLPGIRQIRFMIVGLKIQREVRKWAAAGIGMGVPNEYDMWVLWGIYRGWC